MTVNSLTSFQHDKYLFFLKETNASVCVPAAAAAVWQRVTVMEGQTLRLSCPLSNPHNHPVEWKNPEEHVMYFNDVKGE